MANSFVPVTNFDSEADGIYAVEQCAAEAARANKKYFGLEDPNLSTGLTQCYVGDSYTLNNLGKCSDPNNKYGGINELSVYQISTPPPPPSTSTSSSTSSSSSSPAPSSSSSPSPSPSPSMTSSSRISNSITSITSRLSTLDYVLIAVVVLVLIAIFGIGAYFLFFKSRATKQ